MKDSLEQFLGFAIFGLFVLLTWLAWPVSLWLIIAGICALMLHVFATDYQKAHTQNSAVDVLIHNVAIQLRNAVLSIGVGLTVVSLAQAVLSFTQYSSPVKVRHWEEALVDVKNQFSSVLGLSIVVPVLVVLLFITVLWPDLRLVKRFTSLKKWGSRTLLALTTVASFTFFSVTAVSVGEPKWIAARRPAAEAAVKKIREQTRELVATAWIEERVKSLPPENVAQLRTFLEGIAEGKDLDSSQIDDIERLADSAPGISINSSDKSIDTDAFERTSAWLNSGSAAPSLQDLSAVPEQARRVEQSLSEAQTAAQETIKSIISDAVPKHWDPLIRAFMKALSDSLVKSSFSQLDAHRIQDFASARTFVTTTVYSSDHSALGNMVGMWVWKFRARDTETSGGSYSGYSAYDSLGGLGGYSSGSQPDFSLPNLQPNRLYVPEFRPRPYEYRPREYRGHR